MGTAGRVVSNAWRLSPGQRAGIARNHRRSEHPRKGKGHRGNVAIVTFGGAKIDWERKERRAVSGEKFSFVIAETGGKSESFHSTGNMMTYPAQFGTENKRKLIDNGGFESDEEYQDTSPLVKQTQESQKYTGEENVDDAIAATIATNKRLTTAIRRRIRSRTSAALDGLMTLADAATPLKKLTQTPRKVSSKIDRKKKGTVPGMATTRRRTSSHPGKRR